MIIIGNKETFAVQFELDDDCSGKWMLGKFCFYINNQMIGDYNMGATLSVVLNDFHYIKNDIIKQESSKLFNLNDRQILGLIVRYCYDDFAIDSYLSENADPNCFRISIGDECMDAFFLYVVNNGQEAKIIYGKDSTILNDKYNFEVDPNNLISNIIIPQKEFDDVIEKTYLCLNDIYKKIEKAEN